MDWQPIETAPPNLDLELGVQDRDDIEPLIFACRRTNGEWFNSKTRELVLVRPTHWRFWRKPFERE